MPTRRYLAHQARQGIKRQHESAFVHLRSLFGCNWADYLVLLGARMAGKSYAVRKYILNKRYKVNKNGTVSLRLGQDKMIAYWLRLSESSMRKLLQSDASKLVDADLVRRYKLNLHVENNNVYNIVTLKNGKERKDLLITVLALSTFYNDKGSAYFDNQFTGLYIVVCDEMNREKSEKNNFDIVYNFKNQLENLIRNSGGKQAKAKAKIIMIGNTLSEASDMLLAFNFLPQPGAFGRYKLRSKRCIIDYLPLTQSYKKMREGATVDILKSSDESTFTNEVRFDSRLITTKGLVKPQTIIKFKDDPSAWFTVWDDGIIAKYKGEQIHNHIAMRRYLQGERYIKDQVDNVIALFDSSSFKFHSFYEQELFRKELRLLKPQR